MMDQESNIPPPPCCTQPKCGCYHGDYATIGLVKSAPRVSSPSQQHRKSSSWHFNTCLTFVTLVLCICICFISVSVVFILAIKVQKLEALVEGMNSELSGQKQMITALNGVVRSKSSTTLVGDTSSHPHPVPERPDTHDKVRVHLPCLLCIYPTILSLLIL